MGYKVVTSLDIKQKSTPAFSTVRFKAHSVTALNDLDVFGHQSTASQPCESVPSWQWDDEPVTIAGYSLERHRLVGF